MSVTKFFKIEIDEIGADYINAPSLKLILDAALIDEKAEDPYYIRVEDLTEGMYNLHANINALHKGLLFLPFEEKHGPYEDAAVIEEKKEQDHNDLGESVQERNEKLRLKNERKTGPAHNTPGKGTPCAKPEIFKDKLREGGSISFCPACGHQYKDTDLIQ